MHKMVADVDPRAKALEDYEAAATSLLEILQYPSTKPERHGEAVAV
jgi:hypothetical protein